VLCFHEFSVGWVCLTSAVQTLRCDAANRNDTSVNIAPPQPFHDVMQDHLSAQEPSPKPPNEESEPPHPVEPENEQVVPLSAFTEDVAITSAPPPQPIQVNEPITDQESSLRQLALQTTRVGGDEKRFSQIQKHVASLRIIRGPTERLNDITTPSSAHSPDNMLGQIAAPMLPDFDLMFDDMGDVEEFIRQSQTLRAQRHSTVGTRQSQVKETELTLRLQQAQRQIILLKQHIQKEDGSSPEREHGRAELVQSWEQETTGETADGDNSQQAQTHQTRLPTAAMHSKLQKEFMVRAFAVMHLIHARLYLTSC